MAYQVKYRMESHMLPDKDDWASVEEFTEAHDTDEVDFKSDLVDPLAKYKSATTTWAVESGTVFMTCTYNTEADYTSSVADYQTARAAAGVERRTKQVVVSAAEV